MLLPIGYAMAQETLPEAVAYELSDIKSNRKTIDKLKEKYKGREDVTIIEIGSAMTRNMAESLRKSGNDESAKMMESITSLTIMVESGKEFDFFTDIFDLKDKMYGLELITTVDRFGEYSTFYFGESGKIDKEAEFLMCVRRKENRIMLYVTGDFTVADISELSSLGGIE